MTRKKNTEIDPKHIAFLKDLKPLEKEAQFDDSWLPLDANRAFIICVGSGPWKDARRHQVQEHVLSWYRARKVNDFAEIDEVPSDLFPFRWQTKMVENVVRNLKTNRLPFKEQCAEWDRCRFYEGFPEDANLWIPPIKEFFQFAGSPEGTKVLWLFVRDFLLLPGFPIDRWVARNLKKHGFPEDAWYMTRACIKAGVSPNILNRVFFLKR